MTPKELKQYLDSCRLNKTRIEQLVSELVLQPELSKPLLEHVFKQDAIGESFNASWVFDHLMRKKLDYLLPHLDIFVQGVAKLRTESCMRPMAHVMQMLNLHYFKKKDPAYIKAISATHQEVMVTTCFDWLIEEHKVATKVFAMTSLFYLGKRHDWIHPELKSVLELQMADGTAGFKNRGGKILTELNNLGY